MSWREIVVARILLLVARMCCDDPALQQEIKHLASHVQLYGEKHAPAAES